MSAATLIVGDLNTPSYAGSTCNCATRLLKSRCGHLIHLVHYLQQVWTSSHTGFVGDNPPQAEARIMGHACRACCCHSKLHRTAVNTADASTGAAATRRASSKRCGSVGAVNRLNAASTVKTQTQDSRLKTQDSRQRVRSTDSRLKTASAR
jgi:hypothetical protein